MQPAFARQIAAEIKSVVPGLESDEVVFGERRDEALVVRQRCQHFGRRTRDMKKKADAILVAALAEGLCERHQVVIMNPDDILGPDHTVKLAREVIIDTQIAAQITARELGKVDTVV